MKLKQVKFVHRASNSRNNLAWDNLTHNGLGEYKNIKLIHDPNCKDYDWFVVLDDIPKVLKNKVEYLNCHPNNTLFVNTEPSSITRYGNGFVNQFNHVITNHEEKYIKHPNVKRSQTGNIWMYGKSYDEIIALKDIKKTKKISTICSNKSMGHTLHKLRFDFTKKLQEEIEITRCGWGYNPIDKKYEAIDDYEFHVCIENHIGKDVWTEKIADAFLGYSIPIYYGCPNIYDYFPKDSLILIDLNDFEGSIRKIKEIISTPGEYERRLPAIKEARKRIIEDYGLIAMINKIVTENSNKKNENFLGTNKKIYSRRVMRVLNPLDFISFARWKIVNFTKNLYKKKKNG